MKCLFITATGTDVGKTLVCATLCYALTRQGRAVVALKPVVSGFDAGSPRSDPALLLESLGREPTPSAIARIAPWRFQAPVSPHLAARLEDRPLAFDEVVAFCRDHEQGKHDRLLIEGAGGVMSPIDESHTCLDLITTLGYPVILVAGSYLGTISHTLTAICALRSRGARIKAVVVSESEASAGLAATAQSVQQLAGQALALYTLPRIKDKDQPKWRPASMLIDINALLSERGL